MVIIDKLSNEVKMLKILLNEKYWQSGLVTSEEKPFFKYEDGNRTNEQLGNIVTVSPLNGLASMTSQTLKVKLPLNVPQVQPNDIIKFKELAVTPYLPNGAHSIQYSFSAKGLSVIGKLDLNALIEGGGK